MKKSLAILIILTVLSVGSCSFAEQPESLSPLIKVVDFAYTDTGYLVAVFENTGDIIVPEFEVQFLFKDEEGNILKMESDGHDVILPHSQVVSRVRTNVEKDEFSTIDILIDADKYTNNYENHAAALEIKTNQGINCIIAQITNNDTVTIDEIELVIVFYKAGKIIGASEEEARNASKGSTTILEFLIPQVGYKDMITYDDIKLFVNQAHTFF